MQAPGGGVVEGIGCLAPGGTGVCLGGGGIRLESVMLVLILFPDPASCAATRAGPPGPLLKEERSKV